MARKTKSKSRKETEEVELEVEEVAPEAEAKAAKPPMGIETSMIVVTFFALAWAAFLIYLKMKEVGG